jgi:hypothetical protein
VAKMYSRWLRSIKNMLDMVTKVFSRQAYSLVFEVPEVLNGISNLLYYALPETLKCKNFGAIERTSFIS